MLYGVGSIRLHGFADKLLLLVVLDWLISAAAAAAATATGMLKRSLPQLSFCTRDYTA